MLQYRGTGHADASRRCGLRPGWREPMHDGFGTLGHTEKAEVRKRRLLLIWLFSRLPTGRSSDKQE
jgi:hypothetical protein